jgi:hypothetical protein
MSRHYLPEDALHLLSRLATAHRQAALLTSLSLWLWMTLLLRLRMHRWGADVVFFALVITAAVIFIAACFFLLVTHPGYHMMRWR